MPRDMSHLEGKRTGRRKGSKTKSEDVRDIEWVYRNLSQNPDTVRAPRPSARELLRWVQETAVNKGLFMKRVLQGGLNRGALDSSAEPEKFDEKDESLLKLVDEMIGSYEKQAKREPFNG